MELQERIQSFSKLGSFLKEALVSETHLLPIIGKAYQHNQWFTPAAITQSLTAIADWLTTEKLNAWLAPYQNDLEKKRSSKSIGLIMAGNIPMVGFHDLLCVLFSGNKVVAKCAKDDAVLIPFIIEKLIEIEPRFAAQIQFTERLTNIEAVIATGSNNSARYFDYYFGKYPHIIRKNRNSAAIISGNETKTDLENLGADIFTYFGLGCRNVSKLYVPDGYNFNSFFESIATYSSIMDHNKYINNFEYNSAVYLLNSIPFLTNNFLIIKEEKALATPVSVLHYEYYKNEHDLKTRLSEVKEQLQCIVSNDLSINSVYKTTPFGTSQSPQLNEYADAIDTMKFLIQIA